MAEMAFEMGKRDSRTLKGKVNISGWLNVKRDQGNSTKNIPQFNFVLIKFPATKFTLQIFKGSFGLRRPKKRSVNPYALPPSQGQVSIPQQLRPHPLLPPSAAAVLA
jgi:hypothetical protein